MVARNNDRDEVLANIAENVRRLRKAKGLSQDQLAYTADIDRTYVGYVENRKYNITVGKLCDIAKALDVDVEELLNAK